MIKKNTAITSGGDEKSFAIQVDPKTGDIIGGFAYDQKNLIHFIEDYVVSVERWERGSFYVLTYFDQDKGTFSVSKKNRPRKIASEMMEVHSK